MPGAPPLSPRLLIPRISSADDADFAGDLNAASDAIDLVAKKIATVLNFTQANSFSTGNYGPARPSSPQVQDEVILRFASGSNPTRYAFDWRFIWDGAMWRFAGGPPLASRASGTSNIANQWNFPASTDGGRINVPYYGTYLVRYGVNTLAPSASGAGGGVSIGIAVNGVTSPDPAYTDIVQSPVDGSFPPYMSASYERVLELNAGAVLTVVTKPTRSDAAIGGTWIQATPHYTTVLP